MEGIIKRVFTRGIFGVRDELTSRRMIYRQAEKVIDEHIHWEYE